MPGVGVLVGAKLPVRRGEFSVMRFWERIVGAIVTGLILAAFNQCGR